MAAISVSRSLAKGKKKGEGHEGSETMVNPAAMSNSMGTKDRKQHTGGKTEGFATANKGG